MGQNRKQFLKFNSNARREMSETELERRDLFTWCRSSFGIVHTQVIITQDCSVTQSRKMCRLTLWLLG